MLKINKLKPHTGLAKPSGVYRKDAACQSLLVCLRTDMSICQSNVVPYRVTSGYHRYEQTKQELPSGRSCVLPESVRCTWHAIALPRPESPTIRHIRNGQKVIAPGDYRIPSALHSAHQFRSIQGNVRRLAVYISFQLAITYSPVFLRSSS